MSLPKKIQRRAEAELRAHRENIILLDIRKKDLEMSYSLSRRVGDEPVRGSHRSDPTSRAAVQAVMLKGEITKLEARIEKVKCGLRMCTKEEQEILEMRYMGRVEPTDQDVIIALGYGFRNKYYELRDKGLTKIAKAFGWRYDGRDKDETMRDVSKKDSERA